MKKESNFSKSRTKSEFHLLFAEFFCTKYQYDYFTIALEEKFDFDAEEEILPGAIIEYSIIGKVHAEVYVHIYKFGKKYDCEVYTKNNTLVFKPIFSDLRNTYWSSVKDMGFY